MENETCQFCKIVRKEIPASFVYEDESVAAFLNIRAIERRTHSRNPKKTL
jgi:diadenosine tetraphosphate (Ap4A) HIT family hydrolase